MSGFPLYESLRKGLPKKDITVKQKEDLMKKITSIDSAGKELIYILICSHYENSPDGDKQEILPYGSSFSNGKVEFQLTKLPIDLRQMLYKFVLMHLKNMDDEKQRIMLQNSPSI